MVRISDVVKHLIIINVLFFIAAQIYGDQMYQLFSLWFPKNGNFGFWQIVTHMFMHGGFAHLLFNMIGLWLFGSALEHIWGKKRFLFFYFFAGIGSAIIYTLANYYQYVQAHELLINLNFSEDQIKALFSLPHEQVVSVLNSGSYQGLPLDHIQMLYDKGYIAFNSSAVGASGAMYGVLVAFAMLFPNAELMLIFLPIPIKAKYFVPLLIVGDLFFGFTSYSVGPIAHFAHVGGALFGFIMMWSWKKNQFNNNRWDQ